MSKTEQLEREVRSLPEALAGEVLDFLASLKSANQTSGQKRAAVIRKLRGSWKGRLSTSAEFAANNADEIRLAGTAN
jgi:hypothetical protein